MLKPKIKETCSKHKESTGRDFIRIFDFDDREQSKSAQNEAASCPGRDGQFVVFYEVCSVEDWEDGSYNIAH